MNHKKSKSGVPDVIFLRHRVDATVVHTTRDKGHPVVKAPPPTSKQGLRPFLGHLAFYIRLLEQRATVVRNPGQLLRKEGDWTWEERCQQSFGSLSKSFCSGPCWRTPTKTKSSSFRTTLLRIALGQFLPRKTAAGLEAQITFALGTLGPAERNYAQLNRERPAVVFAAHRFYRLIGDHKLIFYNNQQPLLGILGFTNPVPKLLSHSMARWCVGLSTYDHDLKYLPGKTHHNRDALSRLPYWRRSKKFLL